MRYYKPGPFNGILAYYALFWFVNKFMVRTKFTAGTSAAINGPPPEVRRAAPAAAAAPPAAAAPAAAAEPTAAAPEVAVAPFTSTLAPPTLKKVVAAEQIPESEPSSDQRELESAPEAAARAGGGEQEREEVLFVELEPPQFEGMPPLPQQWFEPHNLEARCVGAWICFVPHPSDI